MCGLSYMMAFLVIKHLAYTSYVYSALYLKLIVLFITLYAFARQKSSCSLLCLMIGACLNPLYFAEVPP